MHYTVAVRTLCEFTAKAGDLDLRFTPAPTALEGMAGHALVRGRRAAGYEAEVALQGTHGDLLVRGRADGFDAARGRLEEIKTHRGDLARQPAPQRTLHWAQLKVYGALLCRARGLLALTLALVYFELESERETVFEERHEAAALEAFFAAHCDRFAAWARQEQAHRAARDAALAALAFPHPEFRPGQRALAEGVYRAAVRGRVLLAQAPTGIGKTVGTLFPQLKAMPAARIDKLFYLAAKTPGRQLALDALARIAPGGQPLRVLELTAREKACEHPDKACHGDACPLARGFYDRLPAARAAALAAGPLARAPLRAVALDHQVCPYYLAQELARWADVVVGDYNYWFDGSALLHALAQQDAWRAALLVDEAHNLPERGRAMYSAALRRAELGALRRQAPAVLKRPLDRLDRRWRALLAEDTRAYTTRDALPATFVAALQDAAGALGAYFAEAAPAAPHALDGALQQFWFAALQFLRLVQSFGPHSLVDLARLPGPARGDALLGIRNLIPAPFLGPRLAAACTATLFSATLTPPAYYRDMLGLPEDTPFLDIPSPYADGQLEVRLATHISTRFAAREASAGPIAALIARQYQAAPGNYLAFFSSHDYLALVAERFAADHPSIAHWRQARRMDEAERQAFLDRFAPGGRGIGFAVLGGSFGEGIDLPGDRLVGAFIATLGLPQVNPLNEAMRARMDQAFGAGHDYAYLYPGLRKVVQAGGRVIRTPADRGVLVLIDERYRRPGIRQLLPAWWLLR
ncbi:ATP-dependent DNA helicase [Pseudorhodoferax sp.]|uniref:ATP-dependent DNA helicase n=1 Tax=Pseudorhodoferax sp. TaxID=1993553 RepID=UPI0039E4BA2C